MLGTKLVLAGQDTPINDYTITMDIKLERLPKHGVALYVGQDVKKRIKALMAQMEEERKYDEGDGGPYLYRP